MTSFFAIVEQICETLEAWSISNPSQIAACKTGEDFERCVARAVEETLNRLRLQAHVNYTAGSHVFPDIVLEFENGEKYGIEVKSSSSPSSKSWKINGNSVLGSTKAADVIDTYIIFGKTALGNQGFRFKRYEDAIANVAVTHSPRYFIDMDVAPEDTFFAKSGLTYKELNDAANPISLITEYFRRQGQRAWWLAESTPAAIRMLSDLSEDEKAELIGYCFAHFPEVFSSSAKKFSNIAMWLVTDRGVVSSSLRDNFSAGGKVFLPTSRAVYESVPRIFNTLRTYRHNVLSALRDATSETLQADWGDPEISEDTFKGKVSSWITVAASMFSSESVNHYDKVTLLYDILFG